MRQVPDIPKHLLVGGGRLARHLAFYFEKLYTPYSSWNRNDNSTADLVKKMGSHKNILLCINDDQISDFYDQFKNDAANFIHFSGTLEHSKITGFHPLMSFGHKLYELKDYKKIHFVGTPSENIFREAFPEFPNPYSEITAEQKSLYHSLCVLSGNGTTLLWDLIHQEFKRIGLPESALNPYLQQVSKNIIENQQGRWTGPWYRKDQSTIQKNKVALKDRPLHDLYLEMEKLSAHSRFDNEKH